MKIAYLSIAAFLGVAQAQQLESEFVTYKTNQGNIKGVVKEARNGHKYHAFLGVPFAKPPVGELRWKPPILDVSKWSETRDATKLPQVCTQDNLYHPNEMIGSEDCLYLNVFTRGKEGKKQVVFWIHGGAFIFGGMNIYDAQYAMEEDIVLVIIQYRLNVFGFMSTEDSTAPGNYGSLDQVAALKWVQENIASFGGDPNQVTIMGMSAGGASVHYLTLSPMTRNLYKNAISLSGSALCWWAHVPSPKKKATKLGEHFKCPMETTEDMVDCLRKVSTEQLHNAHYELFFKWHKNSVEREPMNLFSPRSDPEAGEEAFLPEHPYVAMSNGHINPQPHMIGFTDKEGIWRANQILPDGTERSLNAYKDFMTNFSQVAPLAFGLVEDQVEDPDQVASQLKSFYGLDGINPDDPVTEEIAHKLIDVLSDSMFSYAIDEAAKLRAKQKHMATYYHYFTFSGSHTLANLAIDERVRRPPLMALRRASHGSDMLQIFKMFPFEPMPENEVEFSRKYIKLLLDWGKEGKPPAYLPEWKPLDLANPNYLIIDEEFRVRSGLPDQNRIDFWRKNLPPVYWNYVLKRPQHEEL